MIQIDNMKKASSQSRKGSSKEKPQNVANSLAFGNLINEDDDFINPGKKQAAAPAFIQSHT